MKDGNDYEKQVEGVDILLNSDQTRYFQLFAAADDGPIMLRGQRQDASFDVGQFLGQQMKVIAEQTDMSYEEVAEYGIQEAKTLEKASSNDEQV